MKVDWKQVVKVDRKQVVKADGKKKTVTAGSEQDRQRDSRDKEARRAAEAIPPGRE